MSEVAAPGSPPTAVLMRTCPEVSISRAEVSISSPRGSISPELSSSSISSISAEVRLRELAEGPCTCTYDCCSPPTAVHDVAACSSVPEATALSNSPARTRLARCSVYDRCHARPSARLSSRCTTAARSACAIACVHTPKKGAHTCVVHVGWRTWRCAVRSQSPISCLSGL